MEEKKSYDYLIVGSGLFGCVFAHEATKRGKKCLVIDKRNHPGGNIYCENVEGINVHKYGAHIFHTNDKRIWEYVNSFVEFNRYTNSPVAVYKDELYNLPFNMNTFYQLWKVKTPEEAKAKIEEQKSELKIGEPSNLEEQAISLIGSDIYEKLIKGYTEKQWGRSATELPAFIIKRLPVRFTYDNNYFNDKYQGIPIGGYNKLVDGLLEGIEVQLNVDYFSNREEWNSKADQIVFTGKIDEYYDYRYGYLEYRSLKFEHETHDKENYQGNAVVNYTEREVPYTRIIEHKHFEFGTQPKTVVTKEYPEEWTIEKEAYYPINDAKNTETFKKYSELAAAESNVIFGGRLAEYRYYDMHQIIGSALKKVAVHFGESVAAEEV
jgi:UDP-galactopyranose mutase